MPAAAPASEGRNDPNGEAGNFIFLTKSNLAGSRVYYDEKCWEPLPKKAAATVVSVQSLVFLRGAVAKIIDGFTELSHRLGRKMVPFPRDWHSDEAILPALHGYGGVQGADGQRDAQRGRRLGGVIVTGTSLVPKAGLDTTSR